ncbi:MAG TPA: trypsin-like peptidase domain-containing protein [Gemmatimonadaceae bacterium]|nr:trypsin-like peptidase domain-containing protein [Gemmatimonadaceae bacterium]
MITFPRQSPRRALRAALLVSLAACDATSNPSGAQDTARPTGTLPAPAASTTIDASRRTAITQAVARVAPAVVTVQTEILQRVAADPFEAFFGGQSGQRITPGLGSGFIVRQDGVIVTNAHVVAGATRVSVALRDGTTYPAQIVGVDEANDLAVLKIEKRGLPVAPLGNSDNLLIGEWAIAIGNPYGFLLGNSEPSVTAGVISGTGRNLVGASEGGGMYVDMVQTDAAINPGNSGGPLLNALGEVVGVNSSIYSPSGGSIGLGFAIPINRARRVADDLLAHGAVRRPWIGVKLQLPSGDNPRAVINSGVVVANVVPGSPAARAGLRPGDVIVAAGTRTLRSPFDWEAELLDLRVGESVPLKLMRGSSQQTVNVTVADMPEVSAEKVQVLREMELVTLTPAIRAERGVRSPRGAVIYRTTDRITNEIGLQSGDVIVQINRTPISSADEAAKAIDYYGGRGPIQLFFERGGRVYSTDFQLR